MFLSKLHELGCDIEWLMTGEIRKESAELKPEDTKLLEFLKKQGIDTVDKAKAWFNPEALGRDVALVVAERIAKYQGEEKERT